MAERECEGRGRRPQKNRLLNVRRLGAVLRKRDAAGGDGTASTVQLARDLYADVGAAHDAGNDALAYELAMNKRYSIVRWLRVLADQGVIEYESLPGKGFRWRFLPVPQDVAILASSRGCSSVG